MSKLDELLKGVDVEWLALGKISKILRGRRLTKNQLTKVGNYPVFHGGLEPLGFYDLSNRKGETVMIINVGASAATIGYSTEDFWSSDGCYTIDHSIDLNNKYLYYYLTTQQFNIKSKVRYAGIPTLDAFVLEKIKIPIPCPDNPEKSLEIQQEIVRVLDELTTLTNQLKTELESERQNRKKQFEFFREQMFRFEEGEIQIKPLIEIAEIGTGSRNTNEAVIDGQYPFFVRSQIPRAINEFEFDETAIITAGDGVGVGKVFHYISGKYALHQRAYRIVLKSNVLSSKYLFYYIKNNFSKYIEKISVHASVTSLRKPMFEKYPIPIPPLEEQERIVKLLDQFDATHTAIEEEITKEMKLRTQQYEYYREKLLSFPSLRTT